MVRRQSSATWLLLAYFALVVYASLYPFWPWSWPSGLTLNAIIGLPWPKYFGNFDQQVNLLGYLPLGLLGFAAALRSGFDLRAAFLFGLLPWPALSFLMETLQYFLPGRLPSLSDWLLNSAGAVVGALLGLMLHLLGWLRRWPDVREYWFEPNSAGALALLALWPVGLLFPTPVTLGLGQWLPHLQVLALDALEGTPWALQWLDEPEASARVLSPGLEAITIALGLLGPVLLALSVARPGMRRMGLFLAVLILGLLVTALSTALNFGPSNAWTWITLATLPGLLLGGLLAIVATFLPRRVCAALGLVVLSALIAMVSGAPDDPYLAQSLQAWEQGRFINLYGLAQWIGWIWPFAALGCLLSLIARRQL